MVVLKPPLISFGIISGQILRIPSTVMGLTFVAAGVSVPDAVTSLKVIKEGI